MNLITDAWLPVRRKSGHTDIVAPWQLTDKDDPIVAFNSPRPDFDGALWQFVIGLLQTTVAPENREAWVYWLEQPPDPAVLKEKLSADYLHAFEIQGKRGSFMQDFEQLKGESKGIDKLLIDAPGDKTLRDNTDHFVKRGSVKHLCHSCTAMALFTLQTNAPTGGAGHLTSLRGGGPLTTLVIFDDTHLPSERLMWSNVWLNVLDLENLGNLSENSNSKSKPHDIFPWLANTRVSDKREKTTFTDVNWLQVYWGMPCRIRINWQEASSGRCDLCSVQSEQLVCRYVTKTYGVDYFGSWKHSLSPSYVKGGETITRKLQSGGASYKDWLGLVTDTKSSMAKVVSLYKYNRKLHGEQFLLYVFGYDMDKMKARCWYETKFPLFKISSENFNADVQSLIEAAEECVNTLIGCIKEVWFPRTKKKPSGDTSFLKKEFYQRTQECFYKLAESYADGKEEDNGLKWYKILSEVSLAIFDRQAFSGDFVYADPQAVVKGRNILVGKLGKIKKKLRV